MAKGSGWRDLLMDLGDFIRSSEELAFYTLNKSRFLTFVPKKLPRFGNKFPKHRG